MTALRTVWQASTSATYIRISNRAEVTDRFRWSYLEVLLGKLFLAWPNEESR